MDRIVVRELNSSLEYRYIVYPTTYINPLARMGTLNMQLEDQNLDASWILFDLLLCNGDNYNRFAKAYYDGTKVDTVSIELVEDISSDDIKMIEQYYSEDKTTLKKGVLVPGEYLLHC